MRSLVPWNHYQELTSWHRVSMISSGAFFPASARRVISWTGWVPAMEAFAREGEYVVLAESPGIDPKDVEVSVLTRPMGRF